MALDPFGSAKNLARMIREGRISSEEATEFYLDRIEHRDSAFSSFVQVLRESAVREARAADRRLRRDSAPFLGVPIGVKDLQPTRGSFTRFGSRAFERLLTPFDDETVRSLRQGGFVVVGKTSTSEIGILPAAEPDIHPPTRNPWDLEKTAGGSSGGAAAAVAAGLVPIAQGSDGGGSVRIPASFCGLFGFKPSRGRVPNCYGYDDRSFIYTSGPIARTVDDAASLLDVLAHLNPRGVPHFAPPPEAPFAQLLQTPLAPLRIRFTTRNPVVDTDPEVAAATVRVARTLAELGHHVEEGDPLRGSVDEFLPAWQYMIGLCPIHDWSITQPATQWLGGAVHGPSGKGLRRAKEDSERSVRLLTARVLAWFGEVDLWLTPTVPNLPFPIGSFRQKTGPEIFAKAAEVAPFTAPFNLSGQPAASVPAGRSRSGLPIGVQLVGRPLEDARVLRVALQLEEAIPWNADHPND